MKPITDAAQVALYGKLFGEMMLKQDGEECEFNPDWIRSHGWKVVPVESTARMPPADIPRIVSSLRAAGHTNSVAVFNEPGYIESLPVFVPSDPPSNMPTCYLVSTDDADFRELNNQLGLFRFILAPEDRSWAVSCNEWYNLFAGKPDLVEALLGKPIERARQEFLEFVSLLAKENTEEPLLKVAEHYASM
jgi:hypothetical protein